MGRTFRLCSGKDIPFVEWEGHSVCGVGRTFRLWSEKDIPFIGERDVCVHLNKPYPHPCSHQSICELNGNITAQALHRQVACQFLALFRMNCARYYQ